MDNIHYRLSYVAFLDLMGFKNMVSLSSGDQNVLDNLNIALDYIGSMQHDNYNGPLPMVDLGKEVTAFSDSVVISYDASMPGGGFHVLMDLVFICNDLLNIGIPVRGGVTVGQLIHDERKCFGPAMIEAYLMESKEAIYPRIIINQKVIEYDLSKPGSANSIDQEADYLNSIIKKDSYDDKIFLDYMKQFNEFDYPEIYDDYIIRTRDFIKINLLKYAYDKKLLSKYEWLKDYYNETVTTVFKDTKQLLIK
jgi:hypothetical protein